MKKKIMIPVLIGASILIISIVVVLMLFYNSGNIPKEYRGIWSRYMYFITDGHEHEGNIDVIITKDSVKISGYGPIEYEIDDGDLIIKYEDLLDHEECTKYVLVEGNTLYISEDKKKDEVDSIYYKEKSKELKNETARSKVDYYSENIQWIANDCFIPIYDENDFLFFLEKKSLTDKEKEKIKLDTDNYIKYYEMDGGTLRISVNKKTGKLSGASYTNYKLNLSNITSLSNHSTTVLETILYIVSVEKMTDVNVLEVYDKESHSDAAFKLDSTSTFLEVLEQLKEKTSADVENSDVKISYKGVSYIDWNLTVK